MAVTSAEERASAHQEAGACPRTEDGVSAPLIPKPAMWGLSDALEVVRALQPKAHSVDYHIALAGGVLNKGTSTKDLDLVFLPMVNDHVPPITPVVEMLMKEFGAPMLTNETVTNEEPCVTLRWQGTYRRGARRIDVFIV
jgi:hypothetical protein